VLEILLMLLWLLSFAGYMWLFVDRFRVPAACAPLAAMGFLTAAIYAAGMLRILGWFTWIVLLIGIAPAGCMLCRRSRALLKPELGVFAIGCILLWLRYRQSLLVAYDDFSHWGMIVKQMLLHNRLPEAQDALIVFQSYPPGAACWLYYACRFLGGSDGMMITVQAAMTLAGWMPLFSLVTGRGRVMKTIAASAVTLVGLSLFQGTASLMVDNLLAALAVGTLCLLVKKQRNPWLIGVLAAVICLVKDSGLFFTAVIVLVYAVITFERKSIRKWFGQMIRLCLPALAARLGWMAQIKFAFPAADVSRHALTLENLRATGADKSYADMFTIARKLMERVLSPDNQALQILLILFLAMAAAVLLRGCFTGDWSVRSELFPWLACLVAYAVWVGFMGLMYVFSMTLSNAMQLVAFERYNSTCALFLYGVLVIWLCTADVPVPRHAAACLAAAALLPLLIPSWTSGLPRLWKENYFVPLRSRMEQLSQMYKPTGVEAAVVLVSPEDDSVYADYMARYTFQLPQIDAVSAVDSQTQVIFIACDKEPVLPTDARIVRIPQ